MKCKVVLLPTKVDKMNYGQLCLVNGNGPFYCSSPKVDTEDYLKGTEGIVPQNMYILSDNPIQVGDKVYIEQTETMKWVGTCSRIGVAGIIYFDDIGMCFSETNVNFMKEILASTDESLGVLGISQNDILEYCDNDKIDKTNVNVLFSAMCDSEISDENRNIVLDWDDKTIFTRDECYELCRQAWRQGRITNADFEDWVKVWF
jgi:hypothetical protein